MHVRLKEYSNTFKLKSYAHIQNHFHIKQDSIISSNPSILILRNLSPLLINFKSKFNTAVNKTDHEIPYIAVKIKQQAERRGSYKLQLCN